MASGRAAAKNDVPQTRARNRGGRCYEIAYKALLDLPEHTGWRLVHGVVTNHLIQERMGHAWLKNRELIWDPITAETFLAEAYLTGGKAETVAEYSRREAALELIKHNHMGPWIDHPDAASKPVPQK